MTLHLERLIRIRDAAELLDLSETHLRELVQAGKVKAAILPGGEIGVSQDSTAIMALNKKLQSIRREQFDRLRGKAITVTEASEKYSLVRRTLLRWIHQNLIKVIKPGYKMVVDEADVAFCATIHQIRQNAGVFAGVPLVDELGNPYQLKHPSLSAYRQRKNHNSTMQSKVSQNI